MQGTAPMGSDSHPPGVGILLTELSTILARGGVDILNPVSSKKITENISLHGHEKIFLVMTVSEGVMLAAVLKGMKVDPRVPVAEKVRCGAVAGLVASLKGISPALAGFASGAKVVP